MKLPKSDIGLLFSTPPPAAAPEALTKTAHDAGSVPATHGAPLPLVKQLKAAMPHLWRKVDALRMTKKEQRAELLRLLAWLCSKRGWSFAEQHKQPYFGKTGRVEGRLQACVWHMRESVAFEFVFEMDATALQKLKAAHQDGHFPLLVWGGTPCSRGDLLARASAQLAGARVNWLDVLVLDAS